MWKVMEDVKLVLFSATRTASFSDKTEGGEEGEGGKEGEEGRG